MTHCYLQFCNIHQVEYMQAISFIRVNWNGVSFAFFVYFQGVEGKYLLVKPLKDKFSARSFTIDKTLGKSMLSYKIKHLGEI